LVDTGFGAAACSQPQQLGGLFRTLLRPSLSSASSALEQVKSLGFSRGDVKHIITTHLDVDHCGGIADFPEATVHVHDLEWQAANHPGLLDRLRYRQDCWESHPKVLRYSTQGERWFGFDCVRSLPTLQDEILLIPLIGHTLGHCGVAVRSDAGWLLHCGDAYYSHLDIKPRSQAPWGLRVFATLLEKNRKARLENLNRLRQLNAGTDAVLICSHDPADLLYAKSPVHNHLI
jgi:glyoxylase-like metal-dependent hydrolase (beta-lactamase superfamily II)